MNSRLVTDLLSHLSGESQVRTGPRGGEIHAVESSLRPVRSARQSGGGERPPGLVHETTLRGTGRALAQKDAGVRVDGPRTYCGHQSPNGGYISTCVLFWPEACISPSF